MSKRICWILLWLASIPCVCHSLTISEGKKALYDIVLCDKASISEETAAKELQELLQSVTKAKFELLTTKSLSKSKKSHHIFVGHDSQNATFKNLQPKKDDDESFEYLTTDGDIVIYGGKNRGTMYGVYTFLEEQVGICWLTPEFTKIPSTKKLEINDNLHVSQSPAIQYRYDYSYDAIRNDIWCAHNRLNMQIDAKQNDHGGLTSYWGAHTFRKLLLPDTYFAEHPEYYSLRDGKRIDNGQLCLSNPNVLKIVTDRLLRYIELNPDCWGYDVSQNDNKLFCECSKCAALEKKYGGHSGLIIWFVNQVAATVKQKYPDKLIGTFAYEYSRRPPTKIKPADNVVIRLCDIECCFAHSLSECPQNKDFMQDLKDWKKLTDKIFVWDYVVNFHYYHLPFPNHRIIGDNIQTFKDNGVMGVLELGAYDAVWSDFSEMRQWMIAKLLWNPTLDEDTLAKFFIDNYYGKASNLIWQYYLAIESLPQPTTHTACHDDPKKELYSEDFRAKSIQLLEEAENATARRSSDNATLQRVRRVLVQAYYTRTLLDGASAILDGTHLKLKRLIDKDPTTMRERGQTIQQYLRHHGYI